MKRFVLVIAIVLCFGLTCCGRTGDNAGDQAPLPENTGNTESENNKPSEINYSVRYVHTGTFDDKTHPRMPFPAEPDPESLKVFWESTRGQVVLASSREELQKYCSEYDNYYLNVPLRDVLDIYDDAWYNDHQLIVMGINLPHMIVSPVDLLVEDVDVGADGVHVRIVKKDVSIVDTALDSWNLVIEIEGKTINAGSDVFVDIYRGPVSKGELWASFGTASGRDTDDASRAEWEKRVEDSAAAIFEPLKGSIPVYEEAKLLFEHGKGFMIGRDSSLTRNFNSLPGSTEGIIRRYPTEAIRQRDKMSRYFIYDTDTGYRLYLFFRSDDWYHCTSGYPVLIGDQHSYKDFEGLKVGDGIDSVCSIDSVTNLYKTFWLDYIKLNSVAVKYRADHGYPVSSIHYLTDGILRIQYDMPEDGKLVVSDIVYSEIYRLPDFLGRSVNYAVFADDLPW